MNDNVLVFWERRADRGKINELQIKYCCGERSKYSSCFLLIFIIIIYIFWRLDTKKIICFL
jgi:hypothetical protein